MHGKHLQVAKEVGEGVIFFSELGKCAQHARRLMCDLSDSEMWLLAAVVPFCSLIFILAIVQKNGGGRSVAGSSNDSMLELSSDNYLSPAEYTRLLLLTLAPGLLLLLAVAWLMRSPCVLAHATCRPSRLELESLPCTFQTRQS